MAFVQALNIILRDKQVGPRVRADRCRRGAHLRHGRPVPPDRHLRAARPEVQAGRCRPADVLPRRRGRPGAGRRHHRSRRVLSSWMAAATSYSTNNLPMLPFYIYYSMFGFQRIGDSAWQAADMRARGFLLGATAGRTTLNGEGLQHEDGHSHLLAGAIPNCKPLRPDLRLRSGGDPAARHEAHARRAGRRVLLPDPDERELRAPGDAGRRGGRHPQGHVPAERCRQAQEGRAARAAAGLRHHPARSDRRGRAAGQGLRRQGRHLELPELHRAAPRRLRRRALEPPASGSEAAEGLRQRSAWKGRSGPAIAATDYVRAYADQIRAFVPMRYTVLGTDGFGRSDTRANLRRFFEVDRYYIAHAAIGGAGGGGQDECARTWRGRSRSTRSTPTRPIRSECEIFTY